MHEQERVNPVIVWIVMLALIGTLAWLAVKFWPQAEEIPLDASLVSKAANLSQARQAQQRAANASEVQRLRSDNGWDIKPADAADRAGQTADDMRDVLGETEE